MAASSPSEDTGTPAPLAEIPSSASARGPVDCIIVPEQQPWLMGVASALAARLRQDGRAPLLVAVTRPPGQAAARFLAQPGGHRSLVLVSGEDPPNAWETAGESIEVVPLGATASAASAQIARRFWTKSERVVAAPVQDAEAAIHASTLAAHLAAPLLLYEGSEDMKFLPELLQALGTRRVLVVSTSPAPVRLPPAGCARETEIKLLTPDAAQQRVIRRLRASNVRNIVLARVPVSEEPAGSVAWLAPYVSLVRGAGLVLSQSQEPGEAESCVQRLVEVHQLRPRSLTILGNATSIGKKRVKIPHGNSSEESHEGMDDEGYSYADSGYEVDVEPCMPSSYLTLATMAIGRLPFASLEDASILFARGVKRQHIASAQPARVLMIANPATDSLALPLCEAVSRITASEFKNARLQVDEFYHTQPNCPEARAAASVARLIVYEGHLYHQNLFSATADGTDDGSEYYYDEYDDEGGQYDEYDGEPYRYEYQGPPDGWEYEDPRGYDEMTPGVDGLPDVRRSHAQRGAASATFFRHAASLEPRAWRDAGMDLALSGFGGPPAERLRWFAVAAEPVPVTTWIARTESPAPAPATPTDSEPEPILNDFPVVILQSCDSLEYGMMRCIHEQGGVALLGSVGHVHSASGAAFVKALSDGLLYHGCTLGEAVRDAQNYFFCLQDLKNLRGHNQQAKSQRVALSFQLWGDPELRVFRQQGSRPEQAPVAAQWNADGQLAVRVPSSRLRTVENKKYLLRAFPGSQTAGLVRRLKQRPLRRLTPLYFFRLPVPEGFDAARFTAIARSADEPNRAVFRLDPAERFLYVLYYPDKEKAGEEFTLEFRP
jgi:hypothetical protein